MQVNFWNKNLLELKKKKLNSNAKFSHYAGLGILAHYLY